MYPPKGQALGRVSASWACRTLARIVGRKRLAACRLGKRRLAGSKITTVCATGGAHITSRGKSTRGVVTEAGLAAIAFVVTARSKATIFPRCKAFTATGSWAATAGKTTTETTAVVAATVIAATCRTTKTAITRGVVTTFKTARAATATKIATRRLGSALCRLQTWNHFRLELLTAVALNVENLAAVAMAWL